VIVLMLGFHAHNHRLFSFCHSIRVKFNALNYFVRGDAVARGANRTVLVRITIHGLSLTIAAAHVIEPGSRT